MAALLFATAATAQPLAGQVVGISDGDTLTLLTADNAQYRIRLDGIDAPEATQAFGQRSRQSLAKLAHRKQAAADCPKTDRFGRRVCVVRIEGLDAGLTQIQRGMAWHFVRYAHEQTPENRAAYAAAERDARAAKRGLWRDPEPVPPWEFRQAKGATEANPTR